MRCKTAVLQPVCGNLADVVFGITDLIDVGAVGNKLQGSVFSGSQTARKVCRNGKRALNFCAGEVGLHLFPVSVAYGGYEAVLAESFDQFLGCRAVVVVFDAQTDVGGIEVNTVSVDKQQQCRQYEGDDQAGRVAEDLQKFLFDKCEGNTHAACSPCCKMMLAKASSNVPAPASFFSSAGVPVAMVCPR